jgi:hypothetical protein
MGLECAKALTIFCIDDSCQVTDQRDFKLLLSVVEGDFADEQSQEYVTGHREGGISDITAGTRATALFPSDDLDFGESVHLILDSM